MPRKGFTLIEILVVLAIIATLAALILPNLLSVQKVSEETDTKARIDAICTNLASYESDFGDYPPSNLSKYKITGANKINVGVECLIIGLTTKNKKGPYTEFQEGDLVNTDEDNLTKKPFNSSIQSKKLFEVIDYWGNPLVYIHHRDYKKKFRYQDGQGNTFTVKAQKSKKLGTYFNPTTFQLWSIGLDMLNQNGAPGSDDIKNWKTDDPGDEEDAK